MGNGNARRELLGAGRLVLEIEGRPGPPGLRFETADAGRMLLRQRERPVLLGRSECDTCCPELYLHRLDGYDSPLPPVRSADMRAARNWVHAYARHLEASDGGPLSDGRWELALRTGTPRYIWTSDFVSEWPGGQLGLYCGGGWSGVLPLRRLSSPQAGRVKAYRKHAREGTLAPVLLWWVSFLDGCVLLDGHDRAVAALAEGRTPDCVMLTRVPDGDAWQRSIASVHDAYEQQFEQFAKRPPGPGTARQRAALEKRYGDTLAELPYSTQYTESWDLPGGAPAWDALARSAMFQFPSD